MVDKLKYRVEFAKKSGATEAFLYKDASDEIKKITEGNGVSLAFDAAGNDESVGGCIDCVGIGGSVILVGIPTEDYIKYNPHKLRTKEVTIYNVRRSNQTLADCIKLFRKDRQIENFVTHEFKLEDIQKAFDTVSKYRNNVIKCVITWD